MKITVTVKPNARQSEVTRSSEGQYLVRLAASPVEGKANKELLEVLARYFSVPKSTIRIVRGLAGRRKIVEIS